MLTASWIRVTILGPQRKPRKHTGMRKTTGTCSAYIGTLTTSGKPAVRWQPQSYESGWLLHEVTRRGRMLLVWSVHPAQPHALAA
jgi:hypothetical protein